MNNLTNFTGAINKIKSYYAQRGFIPGMTITGKLKDDFAEVWIDGQQRWVKMNGRGPLVLRTNV